MEGIKLAEYSSQKITINCSFDVVCIGKTPNKFLKGVAGIYFLTLDEELVYIGQTINVYKRLADHRRDKEFDNAYFLPITKTFLNSIETYFLNKYKPEYNKNGSK